MNTGYPIPAGLPDVPKPRTYTQGDPHKHNGVDCVLWASCSLTSDDQQAYLDAYNIIVHNGKGSKAARAAYDGLRDHPWGQLLLRHALGMKETS